jgi:polar amino acid transport system substrate-binding protein
MKKRLLCSAGCFVLFLSLASSVIAETALTRISSTGKLVVGLEAGYKPFEFKDETGKLIGFDIDLVNLMAKEMQVEVTFKEYKFEQLIPALDKNEVDIIASGMTRNLSRAVKMNFSDPYYKTGQVIVLGPEYKSVRDVKDLNKKNVKIGVQKSTTGEKVANEILSAATIVYYDDIEVCKKALLNKELAAFVFDKPLADIFVDENRGDIRLLSTDITTAEYYSFAVKQGDFDFIYWLNYFISEIRKNGEYDKLYTYWFLDMRYKK